MIVTIQEEQLNECIQRLQEYQDKQDVLIEGICKIADAIKKIPVGQIPAVDKIRLIFFNTVRQFSSKTKNHAGH